MREKRWLWLGLLVLLFPLSLASDRFCSFALSDAAYHTFLDLHLFLPQALVLAAFLSIATVVFRIGVVRDRLRVLSTYASEAPAEVYDAFAREARRLGITLPSLAYVDSTAPICFTAFDFRAPRVFVSRGFVDGLDDTELRLLAHHELVHVRDRHATWNVFWHVAFAALVLPGFGGIERALRYRREVDANVSAARIDPLRYERLLARRARERRALCFEGTRERARPGIVATLAPLAVFAFFIALFISHADFMHDLPYLTSHHC